MEIIDSIEDITDYPPSYQTNENNVKSPDSSICQKLVSNNEIDHSQSKNTVDDFEDETILERIIGLGEMFPDRIRNLTSYAVNKTYKVIELGYSFSRSSLWFITSTATLCFLPLLIVQEMVQTEELEAVQQRTMMLGPRAAGVSSGLAGFSASVPHLTQMEPK